MSTAGDFIFSFVRALVNHPQEVAVKQIDGDPIVFEITISAKDLFEVSSKHKAIKTITANVSELQQSQFVLKFIGGEA